MESIQIGGTQYYVVLFPRRVAVFKILEPTSSRAGSYAWEEPDQSPSLVFVSEVGWRTEDEMTTVTVGKVRDVWNNGKQKMLMILSNPRQNFDENADMEEAKMTDATSMTIIPVYVRFDEVIIPDLPITYNWFGNVEQDEIYKQAISGKPYSGGKWFYHVLITHGDVKRETTALKIDSAGYLIQLLTRSNDKGMLDITKLLS